MDAVFSVGLDVSLQWLLDLSLRVVVNRSFLLQQTFVHLGAFQQQPRHIYPCSLYLPISLLIFIVLLRPFPAVSISFLNYAECFCCGLAAAEVRRFPLFGYSLFTSPGAAFALFVPVF